MSHHKLTKTNAQNRRRNEKNWPPDMCNDTLNMSLTLVCTVGVLGPRSCKDSGLRSRHRGVGNVDVRLSVPKVPEPDRIEIGCFHDRVKILA